MIISCIKLDHALYSIDYVNTISFITRYFYTSRLGVMKGVRTDQRMYIPGSATVHV